MEFSPDTGAQTLSRTLGTWDGDTISYSYHSEELGREVELQFNVGRTDHSPVPDKG